MKQLFILLAIISLASCSSPNRVYVITVEYANGDKVCKSFIANAVFLHRGNLIIRKRINWLDDAYETTLASSVRSFEIMSIGDVTKN